MAEDGGEVHGRSIMSLPLSTTNIDDKLITLLLLMDLSKAVDTIDHALLLTKLVRYNFDAHSVFWLSSYLQNRTQVVKIDSKLSSPCHISCGVPKDRC